MEKLETLIKLAHKFSCAFIIQYLKLLVKPLLIGILGFIFVPLCSINPIFAIFALFITIPSFCYAFWKGFCITYILNYAAFNFLKQTPDLELSSYLNAFKPIEKDFIKYISFCAIITLLCYSPIIFIIIKNISEFSLANPIGLITNFLGLFIVCSLIFFLSIPFTNYFTQSYFFKKENESFFNLFLNCYKKLDKTGVIIAISITVINILLNSLSIFLAPILIVLNLYFYSINTFWYYTRCNSENNQYLALEKIK